MPSWDPNQYLRFEGERLRPAVDLLGRVDLGEPGRIYDLGCGAGAPTTLIRRRWPGVEITGVDSSAEMLSRAATAHPELTWIEADIEQWRPDARPDLIFSNAALHWLGDHETLFRRLMDCLAPGGVLAVQMPDNFAEPTHTAIDEVLASGPWAPVAEFERPGVLAPAAYHEMLAPLTGRLEVWETIYYHLLEGDDPVVEWTKGSVLRPVLAALAANDRIAFLDAYRDRVRRAYPPRGDGKTLLPFKRLFVVAAKP